MDAGNELLTVEEVSTFLRKSPSTVYRLTRQGRLPGKKVGGTWRYSRRAIARWLLEPDPSPTSFTSESFPSDPVDESG